MLLMTVLAAVTVHN